MSRYLVRLRGRGMRAGLGIAPPRPRASGVLVAAVREPTASQAAPELSLGAAGDAREHQADALATRIIGAPSIGPAPATLAERVRHRAGGAALDPSTAARIQSARGLGRPLPAGERRFFGARLGSDPSQVRIHADGAAAQLARRLHARAFTVGDDLFFGHGQYRPGTPGGRHLLTHELAHATQQDRRTVRRTIDWVAVDLAERRIDMYLSLGIYGPLASPALAQKWRGYIEKNWSRKLKAKDYKIDARMHVDIKAYPGLPEQFANPKACPSLPGNQLAHAGIEESNAIQVVDDACSSVVDYRCDWGFAPYSCGRWSRKSAPLVVAHETGHLLGLADRYYDTPSGSQDLPGFERDIMANVWNDAGKTDFQRAWVAAILFFFTEMRG